MIAQKLAFSAKWSLFSVLVTYHTTRPGVGILARVAREGMGRRPETYIKLNDVVQSLHDFYCSLLHNRVAVLGRKRIYYINYGIKIMYTQSSLIRAPWDQALPITQVCP